ncbi:ferritin-like domain-containing protein [Clostridium aminobutyricum]|uniref:Ferritin family protein n=1 Tax=Clostridium aminobutyricum TaxID=33953 RepID=A0A939D9C6_CLOAM|nr:ferritin family protein [Clostridium aminobutyricum]MBN7773597.1 ferritin family protein [Clostridium aminobutyricum]
MELLELALSMENDLKEFYQKQAKLNEGNRLKAAFILLAKEEEKHAEIIKSYSKDIILPLPDSHIIADIQTIFNEMKDFRVEIKELPDQLDVYRMALEKEEQSVKFYQDLHDKASEEQSKTVFGYLIEQEKKHCIIVEELIKMASRPEEWIESAEFGLREEY